MSRGVTLSEEIINLTENRFTISEITPSCYAHMKYPKLLPMMRFSVKQFLVGGLGNLMVMDTRGMGGLMMLSTMVFTPKTGKSVPFMLIDTMAMKKKHLAYVEFYDCTQNGSKLDTLDSLPKEFSHITDYAEKPAWYVERRTPYSLIKGGKNVPGEKLRNMVTVCVERYLDAALAADTDENNLIKLKEFQGEMCSLGNPSTATFIKLFGISGAAEFYKSVIMPV